MCQKNTTDGASVNIVVVSDFAYVNGGNASVALSSAIRLAQQGDAVTLFAGAGPVDPPYRLKRHHRGLYRSTGHWRGPKADTGHHPGDLEHQGCANDGAGTPVCGSGPDDHSCSWMGQSALIERYSNGVGDGREGRLHLARLCFRLPQRRFL